MAKAVLTFALYQGDAFQRHETVTQDIVKVGKDPKSHLRVDDEQASRMHAVIEVAGPDDITLIDLGNEPGTLVNGARVNKCKLHVGDQIRVGGATIVLEAADPAVAEAHAAMGAMGGPPPMPQNPFAGGGSRRLLQRKAHPRTRSLRPPIFRIRRESIRRGSAAQRAHEATYVPDDAPARHLHVHHDQERPPT